MAGPREPAAAAATAARRAAGSGASAGPALVPMLALLRLAVLFGVRLALGAARPRLAHGPAVRVGRRAAGTAARAATRAAARRSTQSVADTCNTTKSLTIVAPYS